MMVDAWSTQQSSTMMELATKPLVLSTLGAHTVAAVAVRVEGGETWQVGICGRVGNDGEW